MTAAWRALRRAPGRSAASVLALALAVGAMGVFAVPAIARDSLREVAARDRLAHITLDTTPIPDPAALEAVPGLSAVATRTVTAVSLPEGRTVRVVGTDPAGTDVDVVRPVEGRLPAADDEVALGRQVDVGAETTVIVDDRPLRVVGRAGTPSLADVDAVYTTEATARAIAGTTGPNQVIARVSEPTAERLDAATAAVRRALAAQGVVLTALPVVLVDGAHPIEESTSEISTMIGMLGVVAGVVALVLLASTTNAIVTERSRDAAIMRALGAPQRAVRAELRRVALVLAALGLAVGLPLGLLVSNVVARMVVERFAGLTPEFGWSPLVVGASVAFALVGARLISGRAARRLTRLPLAEALRDRDGVPFGRRLGERVVASLRAGGLTLRMALRSIVRRRGRAFALVAQVACAVGAAACVASLVASVGQFNRVELESWRWGTATTAAAPGAGFPMAATDAGPGTEGGIAAEARVDEWDFDVWGVRVDTTAVETRTTAGRWLDGTPGDVVLADHIAGELGLAVGDRVTLELASGPERLRIVGLHPIRGVTAFVERGDLATRLGTPERANLVWADGSPAASRAVADATGDTVTTTMRRADLYAADVADRNAIAAIFVVIGVVVSGVATVGAVTTVAVATYERRRELAVLRVLGARRAGVRRVLATEVFPLALAGLGLGLLGGWWAARAIMGFFESASGVALGAAFAGAAVPIAAVAVAAFVVLVAATGARGLDRRAPAAILRAAS